MNVLVLQGPNLNLLGRREPNVYGPDDLDTVNAGVAARAASAGHAVKFFQSNSEGELIDALHEGVDWADGALLNGAGLTHTSVSLRDAVAAVDFPVIEVHLSNPAAREDFRHHSYLAGVCLGTVSGFGSYGYEIAYMALDNHIRNRHDG